MKLEMRRRKVREGETVYGSSVSLTPTESEMRLFVVAAEESSTGGSSFSGRRSSRGVRAVQWRCSRWLFEMEMVIWFLYIYLFMVYEMLSDAGFQILIVLF